MVMLPTLKNNTKVNAPVGEKSSREAAMTFQTVSTDTIWVTML